MAENRKQRFLRITEISWLNHCHLYMWLHQWLKSFPGFLLTTSLATKFKPGFETLIIVDSK